VFLCAVCPGGGRPRIIEMYVPEQSQGPWVLYVEADEVVVDVEMEETGEAPDPTTRPGLKQIANNNEIKCVPPSELEQVACFQ
jgi:hypothetical protein